MKAASLVHRALGPDADFPRTTAPTLSALKLPRLKPAEEPGARAFRLMVGAVCKACPPRPTVPSCSTTRRPE